MAEIYYRKKEEVITREIVGETLLVPIRSNTADMQSIFALNPVAEYVWQRLDGEKNINDICNEVSASFDVKKEEAGGDVEEFINELLKADLIEEFEPLT